MRRLRVGCAGPQPGYGAPNTLLCRDGPRYRQREAALPNRRQDAALKRSVIDFMFVEHHLADCW